jgi:isoleucyl-tRNA synthetase
MDYSKTVNLPETDFPMRANLPKREPEFLKKWIEDDIYNKIITSRPDDKMYILHDGPPYANGHIHMGHALNKVLKDIIVKHKTMMGNKAPYVPGWDCHGLPIELKVTKNLGEKAKTMKKIEIRDKCREYATEFINIQREEFKRLGVFADYENPYLTMSKEYEATIAAKFGELFDKGYIFKGKKPIYWCPSCETALAEAEVEYDNHVSDSIFVKFKVDPSTLSNSSIDTENTHVVIWTTTPWTLPANLAVCFHPDFPYSFYKFGEEYYILADGLAEQFEKENELKAEDKITITREEIEALSVSHPFIKRESKVIFGTHVTLEAGTGIVHTAPGHGAEDYHAGLQNGLDIYCPVDHQGRYTDDYPEMKGTVVWDANPKVIDIIKENKTLISDTKYEHSYPHCWRCKKPLIFRATEQWFMGVDINNLREKALEEIDNTQWVPKWGESRIKAMVGQRPDWCLSRQRSWGVPIPSFICQKCGKNNTTTESIKLFAELAEKEGIDIWYTKEIEELIPEGTVCECGSTEFVKEQDILDVWFDSGVSHYAVLEKRDDLQWPADMYLEGSDQHRGWFQSSLWPSMALNNRPPYDTVLTHGFLLDEKGRAMSKSLGNGIEPDEIIKKFGADILRLWVSSEDYRSDLKIGQQMIKQISESYRKIRNTFKFIIGNLSDFNTDLLVDYSKLAEVDKWILFKLYELNEKTINSYETYEFHMVYRRLLNFSAVELSSIYFDISKDILYIESKESEKRRAVQTVLYYLLQTMERLAAPILVFTTEEIWQFTGNQGSIHIQEYFKLPEEFNNTLIDTDFGKIAAVKKDLLKALELTRADKTISRSQEAEVTVFVEDEKVREHMIELGDDLRIFFQVAKVSISKTKSDGMTQYDSCLLSLMKTEGEKCERCWNYFDSLGSDPDHPTLCERCTTVVKNMNI